MSHYLVQRARGPLVGEARVPGDKSVGHRAVIFGALASGRSRVRGLSGGEDNRRTVAAFRALGVAVDEPGPGELVIDGVGLDGLRATDGTPIDCGNSGTTMRLLSGVLASRAFASTLVGDRYLEARPMLRVAEPLRRMGAHVAGRAGAKPGEIYPPLTVGGQLPASGRLVGITHASPHASAQVKSAVLLAGLCADGVTRVREPTRSRDHTERMLRAQGAPLGTVGDEVVLDPAGWNRRLAPLDLAVPGDLSSAAFLLGAAAVVPGSVVTVRGVGVNPTRTGVLDALRAMGAAISVENEREEGGEPVADLTARHGSLDGIAIAGELAVRAIDELPLLAAVAAHARGRTVIRDARELRVKESDRIAAMVAALTALGARVTERDDGMEIDGGAPLHGGQVASHGDHRIAMASAICALAAGGDTRIDDTDNVATSWPGFVPALRALGAPLTPG